jgi:cysteine-rich repeat protein
MSRAEGGRMNKPVLLILALLAACATEVTEVDPEAAACEGKCDDLLGRRTTAEICGAVDPRWGDEWELADTTGEKQTHATDAMACANRLFWSTRLTPVGVHNRFYLHKWICTTNPASHYAMNDKQREFYCSLSLHLRMCNTQGLYAIARVPDSLPRRERERQIFSLCLQLSGELEHFQTALQMDGDASGAVERLYDDYKVQPGLRVAPAVVNPDRAAKLLFERLARISFYGLTVPLELLESSFSNTFLSLDPREHESQIQLILFYRSELTKRGLLDVSAMPTCGDGRLEVGEQCDDGNTQSGDRCTSYCAAE